MSHPFTLEYLQEELGEENVTLNPATGNPCLVLEENTVWEAIEEQGGVASMAKSCGLPELMVWKWIDDHFIPDLYAHDVAWPSGFEVSDVQRPSIGFHDSETGEYWPWSWQMTVAENEFQKAMSAYRNHSQQKGVVTTC